MAVTVLYLQMSIKSTISFCDSVAKTNIFLKSVGNRRFFMAADVRARYTQMIIEKNFIELLRAKRLSKITVKELCELSEINRSTFYKYYEDVYDLFDKMLEKVRTEFRTIILKINKQGREQAFTELLEKIKENKDVYITLIEEQRGLDGTFDEIFGEFFCELTRLSENAFSDIPKEKQIWVLHYLVWGCSGIVHCWVKSEMKAPIQDVVKMISEYIDNTLSFASKGVSL